jgi:hypothetical protein
MKLCKSIGKGVYACGSPISWRLKCKVGRPFGWKGSGPILPKYKIRR